MYRKNALSIIVDYDISHLSEENRKELILNFWGIDESDDGFWTLPETLREELLKFDEPNIELCTDVKYNPLIELAMLESYIGVKNEYLSKKCSTIQGIDIDVVGEVEKLEQCPCCGYKTIKERGCYDICKVCYWEDDNIINDDDIYSNSNDKSINQYRKEMKIDYDMTERYYK